MTNVIFGIVIFAAVIINTITFIVLRRTNRHSGAQERTLRKFTCYENRLDKNESAAQQAAGKKSVTCKLCSKAGTLKYQGCSETSVFEQFPLKTGH
jgi:hypothetical protein